MVFNMFNEYDVLAFTKVLILNEIDFQVSVEYSPVKFDDLSEATSTNYIVKIEPKDV